jgi:hypothetical protein
MDKLQKWKTGIDSMQQFATITNHNMDKLQAVPNKNVKICNAKSSV